FVVATASELERAVNDAVRPSCALVMSSPNLSGKLELALLPVSVTASALDCAFFASTLDWNDCRFAIASFVCFDAFAAAPCVTPTAFADVCAAFPAGKVLGTITLASSVASGIFPFESFMLYDAVWVSGPTGGTIVNVHPSLVPDRSTDVVAPGAEMFVAFFGSVTARWARTGIGTSGVTVCSTPLNPR